MRRAGTSQSKSQVTPYPSVCSRTRALALVALARAPGEGDDEPPKGDNGAVSPTTLAPLGDRGALLLMGAAGTTSSTKRTVALTRGTGDLADPGLLDSGPVTTRSWAASVGPGSTHAAVAPTLM